MFLPFFVYTDALHLTMNCTPNNVYEGQSVTLCCTFDGRPRTIDMWWNQKDVILSSKQHTNLLCHKIVNASRYNSGGYRCYAQNEFGFVTAEVKLKVLCKCFQKSTIFNCISFIRPTAAVSRIK